LQEEPVLLGQLAHVFPVALVLTVRLQGGS
jgi:hypothetical protein